jgi:L-lactate dehydrogenase complex protein LldG
MPSTAAKENILKRIRKGISHPTPIPFPQSEGSNTVFKSSGEDDTVLFAETFTKLQGKFIYCSNELEMVKQLEKLIQLNRWSNVYCRENELKPFVISAGLEPYEDLSTCDASVTGCEYLVARTGTIVMSAAQESGRTVSVYAPVHICIAYQKQLFFDLRDVLGFLKTKYNNNLPSLITFATGPSRTADIEKTLVTGVHGPKEVYCFLIEN